MKELWEELALIQADIRAIREDYHGSISGWKFLDARLNKIESDLGSVISKMKDA